MKRILVAFCLALVSALAFADSIPVLDPSGDVANTAAVRGKLSIKAGAVTAADMASGAAAGNLGLGLGVGTALQNPVNSAGSVVVNGLPGGLIVAPGTTSDQSGIINSALSTYGVAKLSCGTFAVTSTINIPSNSELSGSGPCTIITGVVSLILNSGFASSGNSNISIHDLTLSFGVLTNNQKIIFFNKVSNVTVQRVVLIGDGTNYTQDGIAFVGSDHYKVLDNISSNMTGNACYDNWGGSHDFIIENNHCDGALYGILINGLDTNYAVDTTYNGIVSNNIVKNAAQVGIWAGGLYDSPSGHYGIVKAINISGNIVDTVSTFYGIEVSDGVDNSISNNIIKNTVGDGIRVGSQNAGTTSGTKISNNIVENANSSSGSYSGIYVNNLASNTQIANNQISGSTHVYAISVTSGVTQNTIIGGLMVPGTSGSIGDASTTPTQIMVGNSGNVYVTSGTGLTCLGVAGFQCQTILDSGGNFYPASVTKNLGNVNFAWGQFWSITDINRGSVPTISGGCSTNNQSGGNINGTFKLSALCSSQSVTLTFTNTVPTGYNCGPLIDRTTGVPYYQSTTISTTSATFSSVTGASGDLFSFNCPAN